MLIVFFNGYDVCGKSYRAQQNGVGEDFTDSLSIAGRVIRFVWQD
jgi:hypothetical protein